MSDTERDFTTELKIAIDEGQSLRLTLVNGRQHRVLSPILVTESAVEFTDSHRGGRNVVAWNEIAFVRREPQMLALLEHLAGE